MVLQEQYEGARRKVRAGFATRFAAAILLALVDETFAEETCQLVGGVLAVVGVIALVFTGEQGVQHVVAIVVPLRGKALFEQAGSVVFVLQDEMHVTVWSGFGAHAIGQFEQKVAVGNGMHRIQAQAVEAVFVQPHQRAIDEEIPHLAPAKVDGIAPGRVLVVAEEGAGIAPQVVAVGPEVVIDNVEKHHQPVAMGGVDQLLELFRRAVGGFGRVRQNPVVAPIAIAGKFRQRHQLDGGHAQFGQSGKPLLDLRITSIGAHVQFVEHRFVPGAASPVGVAPAITVRVDHHARLLYVTGLGA